ncbi:unnamed protein product [Cylicocyclus nassatus]|uniref:CWH43-like N-terminal domain-containing protein n=1 Tax=Cylicocyclus nassatus TaxID=53992 RepID=A0AA36H1N0_CYLNA|nr:unnamed protein product [Cylicocyclus nassatus]
MIIRHIWLLPIFAASLAVIGMFCGYIIGTSVNHFHPILPFISDGGGKVPEAAVFSQILNFAGFLYIITIYILYRETFDYYRKCLNWNKTIWWYATIALSILGLLSAFGLTMVANFRSTEIKVVHKIAALLCFSSMVIYGWGHIIFGYAVVPRLVPLVMLHLRLLIMCFTTCCLILYFLAVFTPTFYPNDAGPFPGIHRYSRSRDSPTYRTFIIASSSEWGMVLAIQVFVMSLAMELRNCYGYASRIIFEHDEAEKKKMELYS